MTMGFQRIVAYVTRAAFRNTQLPVFYLELFINYSNGTDETIDHLLI